MAYTTATLNCLVPGRASANGLWMYSSTDAAATVRAADYFSDALDKGVKAGDVVIQTSPAGTVGHIYLVITVDADGADLSDGTAIVATNT